MALADTIAILSGTPLLGCLEPDALRLLAFTADRRRLREKQVLFREGERSDGGYAVLSGAFALTRSGSDHVTLAGPGALIGQAALFSRDPRPASAVAQEPSEVIRVSPTLMRRVLEEFPGAAAAVRDAMAEGLEELTADLERVRRMLTALDARKG